MSRWWWYLDIEKMLEHIKRNYWFPNMRLCNKVRKSLFKLRVTSILPAKSNWTWSKRYQYHSIQCILIILVLLSRKFFLVSVDTFTRFTIIEPLKSQKACYVIKILTSLIYLFRVPGLLVIGEWLSRPRRFACFVTTGLSMYWTLQSLHELMTNVKGLIKQLYRL